MKNCEKNQCRKKEGIKECHLEGKIEKKTKEKKLEEGKKKKNKEGHVNMK